MRSLPFFIVFFTIGVLSLLPPKHIELGDSDKSAHFIAYFTLMITYRFWRISEHFLTGIFILIIYGIILEFLQGLVPGRFPSILDTVANTIGVLLGVFIFWIFKSITLSKSAK